MKNQVLTPSIDIPIDAKRTLTHPETSLSIAKKVAWFIFLLICSLAIFLLGPNYYELFPTNGNTTYAISLAAVFLVVSIALKRSRTYTQHWQLAFAFFIASAVLVISHLFSGYNTDFVRLFGFTTDENRILGLAKLYDMLLVVIPIIVLSFISGVNPAGLYFKIGNPYRKWGLGIGALFVINYFTSVLIFFGAGYTLPALSSAIVWGIVFSFSNSLLEELWVRGLFMKKMLPVFGVTGTLLLTSTAFAAMHFLGVAYLPAAQVPIFVINTFTMGIACGILMVKTDSIWGAYLLHAAADMFLFIATLAAH